MLVRFQVISGEREKDGNEFQDIEERRLKMLVFSSCPCRGHRTATGRKSYPFPTSIHSFESRQCDVRTFVYSAGSNPGPSLFCCSCGFSFGRWELFRLTPVL